MTVRMRHTSSHTGNRRSHHALTEPRLSTCEKCEAKKIRHQACEKCGTYRGRQVLDVATRDNRKEARRKAKLKAFGEPTGPSKEKEVASPEEATSKETKKKKK